MKLYAHPECWKFIKEHYEDFMSFGCGPGGVGDILVPDTVYGLDISLACKIHDWYYRFYPDNTEEGRLLADSIFKNNMLRIVRDRSKSRILRWLRVRRCRVYYGMVRFMGGPAFYDERNAEDEFKDVNVVLEDIRLIRED